jgi:hypothetical protein
MIQITIQKIMIYVYTTHSGVSKTFFFLSPVVHWSILYILCQCYGLVLFPFLIGMTGSGDGKQQAKEIKRKARIWTYTVLWGVTWRVSCRSREDMWQTDSRIWVVLLAIIYRLVTGKGHDLDTLESYVAAAVSEVSVTLPRKDNFC